VLLALAVVGLGLLIVLGPSSLAGPTASRETSPIARALETTRLLGRYAVTRVTVRSSAALA